MDPFVLLTPVVGVHVGPESRTIPSHQPESKEVVEQNNTLQFQGHNTDLAIEATGTSDLEETTTSDFKRQKGESKEQHTTTYI